VKYWFQYSATATSSLSFTGDDDVWVFINGKLVLDLGGLHVPRTGTLTLSGGSVTGVVPDPVATNPPISSTTVTAASLGLVDGKVHDIEVFQAERKRTGSTYMLTVAGFNISRSICKPICGDAVVSPGEQCDNGKAENTGGYNKCNPDCTRGPWCGDGVINGTEQCDDGANVSTYSLTKATGCAPGCMQPAYCGDAILQDSAGEVCDDGKNDNSYNGCSPTCQKGPWCGDAVVQSSSGEACDDGKNDGTYGTCAEGCKPAPGCGDGVLQEDWGEQCDLGAAKNVPGSGCSPTCKKEGVCGDGITQANEQCDDGQNLGGYGKCAPECKLGQRCGDGVKNGPEQCDDGKNAGGYGQCAPGCVYGPRCGDGVTQPGYEECDHGAKNGATNDSCTAACKVVLRVPK